MKIIGLTGGTGAGKTTVCKILEAYGAFVIAADYIGHEVIQKGTRAYNEIVQYFGDDYILEDGQIDRKKLAGRVFSDPLDLKKLNEITHPRIKEKILSLVTEQKTQSHYRYIVIDAALLIEIGLHHEVDEVWVVTAPLQQRINRIMIRDGLTKEEAKNRIASQKDIKDLLPYADVIIENKELEQETQKQVIENLYLNH